MYSWYEYFMLNIFQRYLYDPSVNASSTEQLIGWVLLAFLVIVLLVVFLRRNKKSDPPKFGR